MVHTNTSVKACKAQTTVTVKSYSLQFIQYTQTSSKDAIGGKTQWQVELVHWLA